MNGRTPNQHEERYIEACVTGVGCIACRMDGDPQLNPNESYMTFHHDPDYGSVKPDCHLYGMGLCVDHHQGVGLSSSNQLARHRNQALFTEHFGSDLSRCKATWLWIPILMKRQRIPVSSVMDYCPFDEIREQANRIVQAMD